MNIRLTMKELKEIIKQAIVKAGYTFTKEEYEKLAASIAIAIMKHLKKMK